MKFFAYVALVATTSAISLKNFAALSALEDKHVSEVTEAEWHELGSAIYSETDGGETMTFKELVGVVKKWAEKHEVEPFKGWKKMLRMVFDHVDADHSGDVTREEMDKAIAEHEGEDMLQTKSKGPEEDFEKAIRAELDHDGSVELGELYEIIEKIADKYDYTLPKGWKKHVKAVFDHVDANGDGKVTGPEIEKAMEEDDDVQLSAKSKGPEEDFEKAIKAELEHDGSVSLGELYEIIKKIAKKYDFKLPKGWKKHVKAVFDHVDANGDGEVTGEEIQKAMDE